jgi:hypothetical protein
MLVPGIDEHPPEHGEVPEAQRLLPTELDFYQAYGWCLNPYPTVRGGDRTPSRRDRQTWRSCQRGEAATNVLLLPAHC